MRESGQTDTELLADWLNLRHEAAFRQLVGRYAGLVHAAAKRTSGDDTLAAEASQLVFILLVRKAASLSGRTSLAGWLHLTAVMQAKNLMRKNRREARKRQHLQAAMDPQPSLTSSNVWKEMQPILDEALAALSKKDREALLLRFYRSLSIREIASTLGIATDAAQKRIDRATERLRDKLARRGCQAGGSLAAAMLAGFATDAQAAAPTVSILTSQALAGSATATSNTLVSSLLIMKTASFVSPAIVLVIAGAWIGSQRQTIHALDRQSVLLEGAIVRLSSTAGATRNGGSAGVQLSAAPATGGAGLDWNDIARRLSNSGFTDMDEMKLDLRMRSLSQEEMLAAMDEIALLSVSEKIRDELEYMVVFPFSKRFPEFAVRNLTGRELGSSVGFYLPGAFEAWAKKDAESARTWLDAEVAAGTFESKTLDGKNWMWIQYEAGLLRPLLLAEGGALEARLGQLPADMHKDLLHSLGTAWKPMGAFEEGEEEAFCKLVRNHLSVGEQVELFVIRADQLDCGGFAAVDKFLKVIEATQDERIRCVQAAAISNLSGIAVNRTVRREDVVALHDWLRTQMPQEAERLTGESLGDAAGHKGISATNYRKLSYAEAAAFAVEFSGPGGNDQVMVSFLKSEGGRSDKNQARVLAARITDKTVRQEILNTLK